MATTPNRTAANRANARKSTGPKSPEGKARSAQNARKHPFNPDPFTILRLETPAEIAAFVDGAIATYQPINFQERVAVERIALTQLSMRRMSILESGFFTNCCDKAMCSPEDPNILERSDVSKGVEVTRGQNHAFWFAFGFNVYIRQPGLASTFLRFQAQAERLYRRAVEDFHRLLKLRDALPPEKYEEPNEPNIEPIPAAQPTENAAAPADAQSEANPQNEPNEEPAPHEGASPGAVPVPPSRPAPASQKQPPPRRRHATNPRDAP